MVMDSSDDQTHMASAEINPNDGQDQSDHDVRGDQPSKKEKRGVIYLSSIPEGMNPQNLRILLGRYGEVDRIYLEPAKMRNGKAITYNEGWVEFKKKRIAKEVAANLNGAEISANRRSKLQGAVWTMKYLHRFKWSHLTEQMNYEKMSRNQRLRLEMGRVRREADFYSEQLDVLRHRERKNLEVNSESVEKRASFYQRKQKDPKRMEQSGNESKSDVDKTLLNQIFS